MKKPRTLSEFESSTLRQYFENIIAACRNTKVDERPYIESVAKCGLTIIDGI